MSVTRRKYRANGKTITSKFWTAVFRHKGKLYRQGGFRTREAATHWKSSKIVAVDTGRAGISKKLESRQKTPINDVVDMFVDDLRAKRRDDMYVYNSEKRLKRLADECGWLLIQDMNAEDFSRWRSNPPTDRKRKKINAPRTFNQYLEHLQQFAAWCKKRKYVLEDDFADLDGMTVTERMPYRRAATSDEVRALLSAVDEDRRFLYRFVLYVPLRRDTLEHLTWGDIDLDANPPQIRLKSETNKSRRIEKSYIVAELVPELRRRKRGADDLVFENVPTASQIADDWANAGVNFSDQAGRRRLDLHSFRKTAIKWMKQAGVTLEEASLVLHHKDIRTTQKHYDEDTIAPPITHAVEKMEKIF